MSSTMVSGLATYSTVWLPEWTAIQSATATARVRASSRNAVLVTGDSLPHRSEEAS